MKMRLTHKIRIGDLAINSDTKVHITMKNGTLLNNMIIDYSRNTEQLLDYEENSKLYVRFDNDEDITDLNNYTELKINVSEIEKIEEEEL